MSKPLIAGIDIGTTTGLAIYDLDKNLLYTGSKKNFSVSSIIKEIMNYGTPLIVATDKKKVSPKIRKISATFGSKVFSPDHDLTIEEKENILRINIKDAHERDALAAASFAFREHEALFNNINRSLNMMNLSDHKDKVKEMIIKGKAKNIADAVDRIRPREETKVKTEFKEVNLDWKEKANEYVKRLKDKERKYEISRLYSEKLEDKVKTLERQKKVYQEEETKKNEKARKELLKEKEIQKLNIVIKQLHYEMSKQKELREAYEEKIRKQEEVIEIQDEGLVAVIKIPDFSKEDTMRIDSEFKIENKVVWIENYKPSKTVARILIKKKPKIVIAEMEDKTKYFLKRYGLIVVDGVKPEMRKFYCTISPKELESTMKKMEKRDFLKWLDEYRRR
jgi:predicted RNase H-like nuclease (RuvC/YqgF family)